MLLSLCITSSKRKHRVSVKNAPPLWEMLGSLATDFQSGKKHLASARLVWECVQEPCLLSLCESSVNPAPKNCSLCCMAHQFLNITKMILCDETILEQQSWPE